MNKPKAVALCSGGLDSSTLAYLLGKEDTTGQAYIRVEEQPSARRQARGLEPAGYALHLLSINYGQRHRQKELEAAQRIAAHLGARHDVLDLSGVAPFLKGSALTDEVAVPHGHYAASTMALTVVPNRNALLLALAFAVAVGEGAELVAAGMHAGDHPIYPDCRPAFVAAFDAMERLATEGYAPPHLRLVAPFVEIGKHDIVDLGSMLGVPFEETWSCYEGGDLHCGRCGTCVERKEAFRLAGVPDRTTYLDAHYAPASPLAG